MELIRSTTKRNLWTDKLPRDEAIQVAYSKTVVKGPPTRRFLLAATRRQSSAQTFTQTKAAPVPARQASSKTADLRRYVVSARKSAVQSKQAARKLRLVAHEAAHMFELN